MIVQAEYTDTFGGEPNYCWVRRIEVVASSELACVRKVKRELGLSGVPCKREDYSDQIVLRPYRSNTVLFINFI